MIKGRRNPINIGTNFNKPSFISFLFTKARESKKRLIAKMSASMTYFIINPKPKETPANTFDIVDVLNNIR